MLHERCIFMVIESGTPETPVIQREAHGMDQVQRSARICAQAYNISGILRNFRFMKNDVKHGLLAGALGEWRSIPRFIPVSAQA